MADLAKTIADLEKAHSHFEKVADSYINNLSALADRKAQEVEAKKKKMEFMLSLAEKIDKLHYKIVRKFKTREVATH